MNETDKAWRERLYSQIVEAYGKALYTYTTQQKAAGLKERSRNILSIVQITLTSISSVGIISSLIASQYLVSLIAGLCSALSLALNLYSRGGTIHERYPSIGPQRMGFGQLFRITYRC